MPQRNVCVRIVSCLRGVFRYGWQILEHFLVQCSPVRQDEIESEHWVEEGGEGTKDVQKVL